MEKKQPKKSSNTKPKTNPKPKNVKGKIAKTKSFKLLIVIILIILVIALCLISRYFIKKQNNANLANSSTENAWIEMKILDYQDTNIAEIPKFVSAENSEAVAELNSKVTPLIDLYDTAHSLKDGNYSVEIKSYPFTSDKYMQLIATAIMNPISNTQGDVYSFNYDKAERKILNLEDAYKIANTSENELTAKIQELYSKDSALTQIKIQGFLLQDSTTKFFVKIYSDSENKIYVYDLTTNTLTNYDGNLLFEASEPDSNYIPKLNYAR